MAWPVWPACLPEPRLQKQGARIEVRQPCADRLASAGYASDVDVPVALSPGWDCGRRSFEARVGGRDAAGKAAGGAVQGVNSNERHIAISTNTSESGTFQLPGRTSPLL